MTECKEIGYKPIKGADHKKPVYHYEMVPGDAYRMVDGIYQPTKVDKKICDSAEQSFRLGFLSGKTIVEFAVGDETYGQPLPGSGTAKKAPAEKPKKSIAAKLKEAKAIEIKKSETPPKAAPPPSAKPKRAGRKGGYGLD